MKEIVGTHNRVMEVNLTHKRVTEIRITDHDRKRYLGAKGLGLKLLYERMKPGIDPLGEENFLAFMTGVLVGTGAPCSGRFSALTKSPLTGILTHGSCGGPFGLALKLSGWDGLLVTGKADHPTWLLINEAGVRFRDATDFWGKDTRSTQEAVNPEGKWGALAIGPAGENAVRFANIASGHRFFGRGGMGAVMGAKGLKAIVAEGHTFRILPKKKKQFQKARSLATAYIHQNPITSQDYRRFGTASHVNWCLEKELLPIENFRRHHHPLAVEVSGQAMADRYESRPRTCKPCTIGCGHEGTVPGDSGPTWVPEYESVGLLGPNLGIYDPDAVTRWNETCNLLGLDTISTGSVLGWVMEAGEKGLIDTSLSFGSTDGIQAAIEDIACRRHFGNEMAEGTRRLSETYGGEDFAIQVKGLELSAYDPRGAWGQGLSYAVANRGGCHLSSALFALETRFGYLCPRSVRGKARFVDFFENLYAALNAMHTCQFTAYAYLLERPLIRYTPKWLLSLVMGLWPWLAVRLIDVSLLVRLYNGVTGLGLSPRRFLRAGARIHTLERLMNTREGIRRKDDTLPQRFLETGRAPEERPVPLHRMLDTYYRIRGYDPLGVPRPRRLASLGIPVKPQEIPPASPPALKFTDPAPRMLLKAYLSTVFWFLGKSMQAADRFHPEIRREVDGLPEGFSFFLGVAPRGPALTMARNDEGRLVYRKSMPQGAGADLRMTIGHPRQAWRMFTLREKTDEGIIRNHILSIGDTTAAFKVVRIMEALEVLLLPKCLAKRAVRRYPAVSFWRMWVNRIRLYGRTLWEVVMDPKPEE